MASRTNLVVDRGTTYVISGTYKEGGVAADITGAAIRFTVKSAEWDSSVSDTTAVITKSGTLVSPTAGAYTITLTDTDTYVTPGNYYYSIKIELASGVIHKLVEGRLKIDGDPTNRTA